MRLSDWSGPQLFLLAGVAPAIRDSCTRASQLPEGAYDGIECHPPRIQLIGYYVFDNRESMNKLYLARLAEYGVKPESGQECHDGKPGEGIDVPGLSGYEVRVGCYVDDTGVANARIALPNEAARQSVYVGAVGTDKSIDSLFKRLFPAYTPGAAGCSWCADQIWSVPTGQ